MIKIKDLASQIDIDEREITTLKQRIKKESNNSVSNVSVISAKDQTVLKNMVESKGYRVEEIFPNGLAITGEQYLEALSRLKDLKARA